MWQTFFDLLWRILSYLSSVLETFIENIETANPIIIFSSLKYLNFILFYKNKFYITTATWTALFSLRFHSILLILLCCYFFLMHTASITSHHLFCDPFEKAIPTITPPQPSGWKKTYSTSKDLASPCTQRVCGKLMQTNFRKSNKYISEPIVNCLSANRCDSLIDFPIQLKGGTRLMWKKTKK